MFPLSRLHRSPDPAEGASGDPQDPAKSEGPPLAAPASPKPASPLADPPIAAKTVLEGVRTEKELALERKLKERETRLAELEDENRTLKTPPPRSVAPTQAVKQKKSFLDGATFFDGE